MVLVLAVSVTQRVKEVKQPYGGYIKRKDFEETKLGKGEEELLEDINVDPSLIGMALDYMTRFMLSKDIIESFKVSILGAIHIKEEELAKELLRSIKGLDDESIRAAIKLAGFDVVVRAGRFAYVPVASIEPNQAAIENTRLMIERTIKFFQECGPIVDEGFTFQGAYTDTIGAGDADYMTEDTLWDLKALKNNIGKNHTLQLLVYWRMGLRSDPAKFEKVKKLGIYNPRKNTSYVYELAKLDPAVAEEVDREVIGYDD